jgi:hypothetical protein
MKSLVKNLGRKTQVTSAVTGVIFLTIGIPVAFAHTTLIASNPARNAVLSKLPSKITLTFEDPLLTLGKTAINHLVVTDPMGMVITSGIDVVKGAALTDVFKSGQATRGKYNVSYRVSAQDGHIVSGKFTFSIK